MGRSALDLLRKRLEDEQIETTRSESEPDWQKLRVSLSREHSLSEVQCDELTRALERLWLLPFRRYEACQDQVIFFYAQLPAIRQKVEAAEDRDGALLIQAFSLMIQLMLQGISLFPGHPDQMGAALMKAIPQSNPKMHLLPIARMLVDSADGQWGANHYLAAAPEEIAIHEHFLRRGRNDDLVADAQHKYENYCRELAETPLFWEEWTVLKLAFNKVKFWDRYGIVRRSPLPDSNWRRDSGPDYTKPEEAFQTAFDLFCCKWFLYGMQRSEPKDEPLVQKLCYNFGPYGTSIFIPGYWSLDPNRDLNWKAIQKLHRARGIVRQGEKLDNNRRELALQVKKAQEAAAEAKRRGIKGEFRYSYIKKKAGLAEGTDDAHVRRMLKKK